MISLMPYGKVRRWRSLISYYHRRSMGITTPVWQTLDCTCCERAVILAIRQSGRCSGFANWTCPHCGGLQELPVIGEVVFAEKAVGRADSGGASRPNISGW
jgi:hypothetical protein